MPPVNLPQSLPDPTPSPPATAILRCLQGILGLLAAALTIAALYYGRDIIMPLVLATLLAFVLAPVASLLTRLWLPRALAVVLTVLLGAGAILGLGIVIGRQAAALVVNLPEYQANLRAKLEGLRLSELLADARRAIEDLTGFMGDGVIMPLPGAASSAPPAAEGGTTPLDILQGVAAPVLAPFATAGLVVLFAIFVLIYREDLRDRVIRLAGSRDLHRTTVALNDAARRLSRFFLAQVALNAGLGVMVGLALWALGMPSPALWGILAGLMRFVPFLGLFIALLPTLLLALAVDPGWSLAFWVLGLFLIAEPLMGQVLEPTIYGHSTGLSPVAVIIAAIFWTFLWGPMGLLLAMPLTLCLVVLGRHAPSLGFLDVILGDRPSLLPEERFYQRALSRDPEGLIRQAREQLRLEPSLTAYHDGVALRALVMADQDWSREVLEAEKLEDIRFSLAGLLEELKGEESDGEESDREVAPRILCTAGRGRLDDLAAAFAAQALRSEGLPALALAEGAEPPPGLVPNLALCCIAVLESGSSAAGIRYLVRRWQRLLPGARIVVGLWHAAPDSTLLEALRREKAGEVIVTSLGELAALCRTLEEVPEPRREAGSA